jgi:transposase
MPAELWDAIPPNLRPAIAAVVVGLESRIAALENSVAELKAQLGQNSSNSSRPPSTDPPYAKPAPPKAASGKKRGGPPGHPNHERTLLTPDIVVPLEPARCRRCGHRPAGDDPNPLVHQVHDVPEVKPHVTEYRGHRLTCPDCQAVTCAPPPDDAVGGYGPRTQAITALLAGGHRLGKRAISQVMSDLFGLPIRPAAVSDLQAKTTVLLEPIHAAALNYTRTRPADVDETGWKQGRANAGPWAAVTTLVTAFVIRPRRNRAAFDDLVGTNPPTLTTDRFPVYTHLPGDKRLVGHLSRT